MNPQKRTKVAVVFLCVTVLGILGVVATVRIAISGYRQGLTEARLRQIAIVVAENERISGSRMRDVGVLLSDGRLSQEDFTDARTAYKPTDELTVGAYRVGDFIFPPAAWSQQPDRAAVLCWTDEIDGFRIMALRDGRTRSLKPRDWDSLLDAGIVQGGQESRK